MVPGKEELIPTSSTTCYFAGQNIEWEFFLKENEVVGFGLKGQRADIGVPVN